MLARTLFALSLTLGLAVPLAAAPKAPEECPIKDFSFEAREELLLKAPTCKESLELFGLCSYGATGDVPLGVIVTEKCEGDFLQKLSKTQRRTYDREQKRCGDKYKNEQGTMYRAMSAHCRSTNAANYSRRFSKAALRR